MADPEADRHPWRALSLFFCSLTAGLGAAALAGWALDIRNLASLGGGRIPMAPSTAASFIGFGVAAALVGPNRSRGSRAAGAVLAALVFFSSSILFVLSSRDVHPEIEKLGMAISGTLKGAPVGHMSPATAFCFILAGASLLAGAFRRPTAAFLLGCFLNGTAFVFLLAYLLGSPLFYGGRIIPPALPTVLAFLSLGMAASIPPGLQIWPSGTEGEVARTSRSFVLVYTVLALGIVASGLIYSRSYEKRHQAEIERGLSTVADLKAQELARWRKERLRDAWVVHGNGDFSRLARKHLDAPSDPEIRRRLRSWLTKLRMGGEYSRIGLYDARGAELMSEPGAREPGSPGLTRRIAEAAKGKRIVFEDFHRDPGEDRVMLSTLTPVYDEGTVGPIVGVLAFFIDPERHFYPMLEQWPTASRTAETFLVRRDGDHMKYLNRLKYGQGAALNLRVPLTRTDVPGVRAVLGEEAVLEGRDYRGAQVVAVTRAVTDSPWSLVVKMDQSEIYAPMRERLVILIALVGVMLTGAGAGLGLVWRRQSLGLLRERLDKVEALRKSDERYKNALEDMMEGCQIVGVDWRYLYLNPAAAENARRARGDLVGRTMMECYPGIEDTGLFARLKDSMERRTSERFLNEFAFPDGSTAWFQLAVQPVPEGVLILSYDVTQGKLAEDALREHRDRLEEMVKERTARLTVLNENLQGEIEERRRAEREIQKLNQELAHHVAQLQDANRELESFSYSVSHDLRAPLRAIDGFSRMVAEDYGETVGEEGRRRLGVIVESVGRMGRLIDDLLAFSRLGRQALIPSKIDMTDMARSAYADLAASENGRSIECRIASLPPVVGDPAMMRQVWANLLGNAVKYTRPRPCAVIEVDGRIEDSEAVYSVRDNGVGFDMQYAGKLFGVFQRLHPRSEFEGTGVGLSLAQRIVHRHGGRVWAEGEIDRGAAFFFAVPISGGEHV